MAQITLTTSVSIGGVSISGPTRREASGQIGHTVELPAAKTGSLSTRSTDTTGEITAASGHGIVDSDVIDVYWDGGRRYGVVVGTVDGDDIPIAGGNGDVLPAQDTEVTLAKQVAVDTDFAGDKVEIVAAVCTRRGHVEFLDSAPSSIDGVELPAGEPWHYVSGQGDNPLASETVDAIHVSNGDAAGTATLRLGIHYNSDE